MSMEENPSRILTVELKGTTYNIVQWVSGDPYPILRDTVGVDTETELRDDTKNIPRLAYLGVYNPVDMTVYIVSHRDAREFIEYVSLMDCAQYYFNAAFDFWVLQRNSEDMHKNQIYSLWAAVEAGNVIDVGLRAQLHSIATLGYVEAYTYNLKGMCKKLLSYEMDKGEALGERADRLTFSPDKIITDSQMQYLAIDCITTWQCGQAVAKQPCEVAHTKGSIVLARIEINGFPVDMRVWDHLERMLVAAKEEARKALVSFGYPDPEPFVSASVDYDARIAAVIQRVLSGSEGIYDTSQCSMQKFNKAQLLRLMIYTTSGDLPRIAHILYEICRADGAANLRAKEKRVLASVESTYDIGIFINSTKSQVLRCFVCILLEALEKGVPYADAMAAAESELEEHPDWFAPAPTVGPRKFMQNHLASLVLKYPKLKLPITEKSGDLKMTKEDRWRLEDQGISDPFLLAYLEYTHARKYLSTYMNRKFIREDGKIHPRFTNILRTGRTSCSEPNLQNLPSREKSFPLKNVFVPPEGTILCATDYSFLELVAFAQSCYTRFGKSNMRDVINAGIDPHRWFAGNMHGIINADTSKFDNIQFVSSLVDLLKKSVSDAARQDAKAANFGFPGGMSADRFYQHCRSLGMQLSMKDAEEMRAAWIIAFSEMTQHLRPEKAVALQHDSPVTHSFYSIPWTPGADEDEYEDDEPDDDYADNDGSGDIEDMRVVSKLAYSARTITGFFRNRCSYNAAMNLQFQGLAAEGTKEAGWELLKLGLGPRLLNYVHDEYLYWLYPKEVRTIVPLVEEAMIAGMRKVIPDVRIGVETSLMRHWNKKAITFGELTYDDKGLPIIPEVAFVEEILGKM